MLENLTICSSLARLGSLLGSWAATVAMIFWVCSSPRLLMLWPRKLKVPPCSDRSRDLTRVSEKLQGASRQRQVRVWDECVQELARDLEVGLINRGVPTFAL